MLDFTDLASLRLMQRMLIIGAILFVIVGVVFFLFAGYGTVLRDRIRAAFGIRQDKKKQEQKDNKEPKHGRTKETAKTEETKQDALTEHPSLAVEGTVVLNAKTKSEFAPETAEELDDTEAYAREDEYIDETPSKEETTGILVQETPKSNFRVTKRILITSYKEEDAT